VLVVTHADSALPLAELAAPSSAHPLYEHAAMQTLIHDIAKRTGVNANQVRLSKAMTLHAFECCSQPSVLQRAVSPDPD